jgi:hypothetical protein
MSKNELANLLKNCSPRVIYVITRNNILKKIFCPFQVVVLSEVGVLFKNQVVWVELVKVTPELKTIYIINGSAYFYYHFDILI